MRLLKTSYHLTKISYLPDGIEFPFSPDDELFSASVKADRSRYSVKAKCHACQKAFESIKKVKYW